MTTDEITRTAGTLTVRLSHDGGRYEPEERGTRQQYTYVITTDDGREYTGNDLWSGVSQQPDTEKEFGSLLSFMGAAADAYRYAMENGTPLTEIECGSLFPEWLAEQLYVNSDEIGSLAYEFDPGEIGCSCGMASVGEPGHECG